MWELGASRAPEPESSTTTTHGTAPGGPLTTDAARPVPTTVPPPEYSLQYLVTLLKKLEERRNSKAKQGKDGGL
jgi:hypothetical protein